MEKANSSTNIITHFPSKKRADYEKEYQTFKDTNSGKNESTKPPGKWRWILEKWMWDNGYSLSLSDFSHNLELKELIEAKAENNEVEEDFAIRLLLEYYIILMETIAKK